MAKEFWLSLPIKDAKRSREFFTKVGFKFNPHYGNTDHSVSLQMGQHNVVVMLVEEPTFKGYTQQAITDTAKTNEVLLSYDAESPAEVDEIVAKVTAAGGVVFGKPASIDGWMYACGFTDPDGHRWNVLHMDMSKMPKA